MHNPIFIPLEQAEQLMHVSKAQIESHVISSLKQQGKMFHYVPAEIE